MSYVATLVALVFLTFASFTTRVAFSAAKGQLPSAAEPKNPEDARTRREQLAQRSRRAFPLIAVLAVIAWAHGLALLTMGVRGFAGTAPGPMPVWVVIGSGIFTCVGVSLVVLKFLKKAAD
ncbi:hypothetical protein [Gleimia hominis]|uniref:hypothetical protein n=1 Tax=Gleimia hominis TaxID=595468 RepID=UPI000C80144B|nr:hypothetical protein [Gleimia hominis]WIK64666.1 hypothetical protein CJ187_000950 [Gleimia hominis]